jgi:enterochelin esterase-like enzyme
MKPTRLRRDLWPMVGLFGWVAAVALVGGSSALAQQAVAPPETCLPRGFFATPTHQSVEVLADGRVTFRFCAPAASEARVISNDIADVIPMGIGGGPAGLAMAKDDKGLWSVTTDKPIAPDNYRFNFSVNGARVPDPLATSFTRERVGIDSTFEVPGPVGVFQAYNKDIAHGMVSDLEYWSKSLGVKRRAKVYLPPGYLASSKSFPVLYLVHGAGDSDDSWTGTGHAHYILDNLIASGKARPMIVVMPFGHTPDRPGADILVNTDFGDDLIKDLIPRIEKDFRTSHSASGRAMAGLSMGGSHTLRYGLTHPELFQYLGVFSMGLGMNGNMEDISRYEQANAVALRRGAKELKLFYYAMGKDDFLYSTVAPTRAMLDRAGIHYVYNESGGGHTWINWRRYLNDFAPRLFQN